MNRTQKPNFISWLAAARTSNPVRAINGFCASPWFLAVLGFCTLLSYVFALELFFYGLVILFVFYVSLFGEDFLPILPLFVFCYISPSAGNNPGKAETSIFYGAGGITILILAALAVIALILRIATDKNMGFKKLFTQKRYLTIGFLVLGAAYCLSGIGSAHYAEIVWKNLLFSLLQFLSLFLLYFLFSATIQWDKVNKRFFAWFAVIVSLTVVGQLAHVYLTQKVIVDTVVNGEVVGRNILRAHIYTGWGMYNNVGAMIALGIPFAWYLAVSHKHGYWFVLLASFFVVATVFTCSRGSILGAAIAFMLSLIYAGFKSERRVVFLVATLSVIGACLVAFFIFEQIFTRLFESIPGLLNPEHLPEIDSFEDFLLLFNDSNRFTIYKEGFKVFAKYPFFGESFYPSDFAPWDFSELQQFSSFFPPRWHNTVVQLLASCGVVGLVAYGVHRVQTIFLFYKNRTIEKSFIAIALICLLAMSLLDCHLFNIGPVFFYSAALLFAENLGSKKLEQTKEPEEKDLQKPNTNEK
ncbi:MAG: O-antigen ligase family protein [Clostridia bacterium]|nr:O-antigen ligase family protein [Clostridia bacterium]